VQQHTIEQIVNELSDILVGRFMGKIFQLSQLSLAIDFGSRTDGYLFISADPPKAGLFLIKRRVRELERDSVSPAPFVQAMRGSLGGGKLVSISKVAAERIVKFCFLVEDEIGKQKRPTLVAQLTGRSSNLFLLDDEQRITHALRTPQSGGQQIGELYETPPAKPQTTEEPWQEGAYASLSEAADNYYQQRESAEAFANRAKAAQSRLQKKISQAEKLKCNLKQDLVQHGEPEQHKRIGDLLLANIYSARREGNKVTVSDYYSAGAPAIELEVDENTSLKDEAARYFARYTKAKRAKEEIATRLAQLDVELRQLGEKQKQLEAIIESHDDAALTVFFETKKRISKGADTKTGSKKLHEKLPGIRRYLSSDGYEILVGRAAHTNDNLTFRIARPHDLWLHAADYPGSHVIIRNQTRSEIPHRTIIEAAQLAAKFSQAGKDSKVTVHYTQRKFLSKPKGAAPGLVRMSSFKTITVEPAENIDRL
jgi:predicted ribosome quality control (RQC) complex YloA/Tae2 family protein